jgi:AraC-like DNA-binding protein
MIYPSESDIIPFVKSITQSLQPYAQANEVHISFSSAIKKQAVNYQPFLLSQSLVQLICSIINLVPPKSEIEVRLHYCPENKNLYAEIENTGINLVLMTEIIVQNSYHFDVYPTSNGTVYRLVLPLNKNSTSPDVVIKTNTSIDLPQFYAEIQKRLRSHFSESEKHMATLELSRPKEAAFMQRINTLIKVNLEDENFDTDALCKAMSLSRTQLFRRLKSLIHQAPANYIKNIRLQKAKELLETTDLTVGEVVFKTGFQTLSHFTHIFQKQYGILPSVFRRSNKSATNE